MRSSTCRHHVHSAFPSFRVQHARITSSPPFSTISWLDSMARQRLYGFALRMQASVEMMSPKSDAGLSSGPAIPGFGAFGQQASGPSSAPGTAGTTGAAAGFGASVPAFGGITSFGSSGGPLTFGSTDSRSAPAFAGAINNHVPLMSCFAEIQAMRIHE